LFSYGRKKHTQLRRGEEKGIAEGDLNFQHITCKLEMPAFQQMGNIGKCHTKVWLPILQS